MAKQQYGLSPWGAWFIEVLDAYEMGARLDRGRSYANTGKVLSLEIRDCKAIAKVRGNYRPFYKVEIDFPPLGKAEQAELAALLEEDPSLLARIKSGELPEELLRKLRKKGIGLIPKRWDEMKRSCSCPDWGDPCKHQAALYYIIARQIDAEPQTLFTLRGIDLKSLAGKYQGDMAAVSEPPFVIEKFREGGQEYSALGEAELQVLRFPDIPLCTDLVMSLLPPSPVFSSRNFALVLGEFYHGAVRQSFVPFSEDSSREHLFSCSHWKLECKDPGPGAETVLVRSGIAGETESLSVYEAVSEFCAFSRDEGSRSYTFLFYLAKFLGALLRAGAYIPSVFADEKKLEIIWLPFTRLPYINTCMNYLAALEDSMLELGRKGTKKKIYATGRSTLDLLCSAFLNEWVKRNYDLVPSLHKGDEGFRRIGGLFFKGGRINISSPALQYLPQSIGNWLAVLHTDFSSWQYRFIIKESGSKEDTPGFSLAMDVLAEGREAKTGAKRILLREAVKATGNIAVLKAPTALSNYLPEIRALFTRKTVNLSEERLINFLDDASRLLVKLGIPVILPKALHRELKPRLVLMTETKKSGSLVSYLNLEKLLDWQWQIALGDEVISLKEFESLIKQKKGIVKFRDAFIRIDPAELRSLLKTVKEAHPPAVNEFLKSHLAGGSVLSFDAEKVIEKLFEERRFSVPKKLNADLRPYQIRGFNWICSLLLSGFGCILADDMGLGKTVQAIAVMLHLKAEGLLKNRSLVLAPAALMENWEREFGRFAPSLRVSRYHGGSRSLAGKADVFLTTYQTAVRDSSKLAAEAFSLLVADEAHLLKNEETRGSKTVKNLHAEFRLALSGTPVENRLEDMRSLFDVVLPGYLGTPDDFKKRFRIPIEMHRQKEIADELRSVTSPFLLRRLKTDKAIIADLPEKIVSDEYAVLEKEQAALYENVVASVLDVSAETMEGQKRSALVLKLLTALKQICDHPRVYDKESPAVSGLSGKARLLVTLLGEILAGGEKTLIFSQYVETLECLETIIRNELEEEALVYHGGLSQMRRSETIEKFQNDKVCRILLVSLRAGGLGLNLTSASRVIHYDLWYNPAVENQATDRAFRIGQKRNVFVHRFITKNSFEEKIEAMLKSKQELADMTVGSGESWLARMSREELRALFER
ncbi:MAG: DEAD/DEAH box helicase [Treponema sp.]|jgi:SNF2 family DNA or RNA helicase|nr:DEAD/DEAH box helicase [Treponema sp.]